MLQVHRWFILLGMIFIVFITLSVDFKSTNFENNHKSWVKQFIKLAEEQGVSKQTLDNFKKQVKPLLNIANEKVEPFYSKVYSNISDITLLKSQEYLLENMERLKGLEFKYQVPAEVVISTMAVGSGFGTVLQQYKLIDIISSLAVKYNSNFYAIELVSLLKLVDKSIVDINILGNLDGTFTLAGITPSVYLYYGIDANNDTVIDLKNSQEDAEETLFHFYSSQYWNYLVLLGEVVVYPKRVNAKELEGVSNTKTVGTWKALGFKQDVSAEDLQEQNETQGTFIGLEEGKGVLLYPNFASVFAGNNTLDRSVAITIINSELVAYAKLIQYGSKYKDDVEQKREKENPVNIYKKNKSQSKKLDDLPIPELYKDLEYIK